LPETDAALFRFFLAGEGSSFFVEHLTVVRILIRHEGSSPFGRAGTPGFLFDSQGLLPGFWLLEKLACIVLLNGLEGI